jgi:hypothetical protein
LSNPRFSPAEKTLLSALASGSLLKSHRYLDGTKAFRLHPLESPPANVGSSIVEALLERGFIQSNQKFPAATLLLTAKGKVAVATLMGVENRLLHRRSDTAVSQQKKTAQSKRSSFTTPFTRDYSPGTLRFNTW